MRKKDMEEKLIIEEPENFNPDEQEALYNFYRVLPLGILAIVFWIVKFIGIIIR